MPIELPQLDVEVRRAHGSLWFALAQLRQAPRETAPNPLDPFASLRSTATHQALIERRAEPLAAALAPWVATLFVERACWPTRTRRAALWELAVPGDAASSAELVSLRQLRRRVLYGADSPSRERAARVLTLRADALHRLSLESLAQRLAAERALYGEVPTSIPVADAERAVDLAAGTAAVVLDRTEDLARDSRAASWWDGLRQSLGVDAREGWPARLVPRWLAEVFRGTGFASVPPAEPVALPPARGGLSFASALGRFGVAHLDQARRQAPQFALHQHPYDTRRHERFGLFASIAAERSFAQRVLRLGGERAAEHRRRVGRAMLRSVRIDAWRVLAAAALRSNPQQATDTYCTASARVLGATAPATLMGVLPELRPSDGAALVGHVLAASQREQLIGQFDEDWFRNPRAAESLRAADQHPRDGTPIESTRVTRAIEQTCWAFERSLT